ncbi:MAG: glucose-6-phosphate isomerase [Porticoccaceae bacterium]|nr:glucose-6-phosphate isomerase [Porticoccaceae bacterium]
MTNFEFKPQKTAAWKRLKTYADATTINVVDELTNDKERVEDFSIQCGQLKLDFSKNLITREIWQDLLELVSTSPFDKHREAMFAGQRINTSEDRQVLHTLLRAKMKDISDQSHKHKINRVSTQLNMVELFSKRIRSGGWTGVNGEAITDVVNIGIGGSDLGLRLAYEALVEYTQPVPRIHFISNVDGAALNATLAKLDADRTLIVVASKTFTTQETLLNSTTAANWFEQEIGLRNSQYSTHFVAVTANKENAIAYGINPNHILEFEEWVGGRFSLWSSIGFSLAIGIGIDNFKQMLDGARRMDLHFKTSPMNKNMPVALALLNIWYCNFMEFQTHAIIPYCERLNYLPSYLQQLEMESNGKSVSRGGETIDYKTCGIIWGQTGTNGQHAFFQLLHQGTVCVPVDFIAAINDSMSHPKHHKVLLSNMLAQGSALIKGQASTENAPHRYYPGNKPSNTILIDQLTPYNLGSLIALYEHKVFVQGSIWSINSFDQWGVELGKSMAQKLLDSKESRSSFDVSTSTLFDHINDRKTNH